MKHGHRGKILFSPTDLCTFLESELASWMDRLALERGLTRPAPSTDKAHCAAPGEAHQTRVLQRYRGSGLSITSIDETRDFEEAFVQTLDAIKSGADVIHHAALRRGPFEGYADFLVRNERPAPYLGPFSYSVVDSKLAQTPRPYSLLQLCAYSDMLELIQGLRPDTITIIDAAGNPTHFRTDDFMLDYRRLKADFLAFQGAFDPSRRPLPSASADHGRWKAEAAPTKTEDEELSNALLASIPQEDGE